MRDLLNLLDTVTLLTESVGLSNRKPGEKFKNSADDLVTFQGLDFYPPSGKFPEDNNMSDVISELTDQGMNIHWTNAANAGTGGFGIAAFTGEDDTPYYLGRYFKEISASRALNNFPHDAIPGGFKYQSKAGHKENSGLRPSDWITQFQNNTPQTILDQCIAKFGQDSAEANALAMFIDSDIPVTVEKGSMEPSAFRDYFAEVLQPIALVMGKRVGGNASEAAQIFFGKSDFSSCTISFNSNTIGGLYDSLLVNADGKQIKLSSKGKNGASASVVNLLKSVGELAGTPNGQKLIQKNTDTIEILETIKNDGHFGAPLKLGVKYGMLTPKEATQVLALKQLGPLDQVVGTGMLSKKLEKMYQARKARDQGRVIPIEHMLAAIAYPLADKINNTTNFGQAACEILNNAALVQMYTDTSVTKDTITVTKLTAIYPSQTITGVLLDASKVYFSTGGKGNYTFKILKNGATDNDVNPMVGMDDLESDQESTKTSADELDAELKKPRLQGPGARASRQQKEPDFDVSVTGREKRKPR